MLLEKKHYFDSLPFRIQEAIVTKFLFNDILTSKGFLTFFSSSPGSDSNFVYQMAFGFMPRYYLATPDDRYILEEEGDVTEITFVFSGDWAVAFNTYMILEEGSRTDLFALEEEENSATRTPKDMTKQGHEIAVRRKACEFFGDYYVLASKPSQFHYVALSNVEAFAISKKFIFGTIFKKFPEVERSMVSESYLRYIK